MVRQILYCGPPSIHLGQWLMPRPSPSDPMALWPQLQGRTVVGTFRGRTAVALACASFGIGRDHDVLVPAYNCGSEVDAILNSGARTVAYRVSRRCEIDLDDLVARRTRRTKAVYVIHYFGWEQPLVQLRRWCDENGLILVEDCALALFSGGVSGQIGRTGDAAIFSLAKTIGAFNGGLLSISKRGQLPTVPLARPGISALLREIRHSAKCSMLRASERLGVYGLLIFLRRHLKRTHRRLNAKGGLPQMPDDYFFRRHLHENRALQPSTFALAAAVPWADVVLRRRRNFLQLISALGGLEGVQPLYGNLPEGICPLSMPLLVSDRDNLVSRLQARGIGAYPWWAGFHESAVQWSLFPDACWLKANLLTLPVHQGLDSYHLDYIAATFRELLRQSN